MPQDIEDTRHLSEDSWSWLPYFSICVSIVILVISLTLITVLCCKSCDRLTCICGKRKQQMSNQTIPILPKMGVCSSRGLHGAHCSTPVATSVSLSPMENQPAAANSEGKAVPDTVIYSVITVRGSGKPAAISQDERTEYAAIKVTNFQQSL